MNTFPSHDAAFRRVVERVAADRAPGTPDELAACLRPLYPRIAVFQRQLSGEATQYYVYRDGRFEPDPREAWWERPDAPCVRLSAATGLITSATGSYAQLMRADPGDLIGRHFVELVLPAARPAAQAMFEAVTEEREVRSAARVLRADGSTLAIEFRAIRRDAEIEVSYRPLDDASRREAG